MTSHLLFPSDSNANAHLHTNTNLDINLQFDSHSYSSKTWQSYLAKINVKVKSLKLWLKSLLDCIHLNQHRVKNGYVTSLMLVLFPHLNHGAEGNVSRILCKDSGGAGLPLSNPARTAAGYYRELRIDCCTKNTRIQQRGHAKSVNINMLASPDKARHVPTKSGVFKSVRRLLSALALCLTALLTAHVGHAALSATTANTIQGTLPYLTFDGGTTKVTTTDGLLGITLSDGTAFKKSDLTGSNPGTSGNPIELPVAGQKLEDITTLIPSGDTSVTLNALVTTHNYWGDADGDGVPTVSGSGTLSISAKDANNNAVSLTSALSACSSPYKVTLMSTAGTLSTQYGDPKTTSFTGDSVDYYINPNMSAPYACWVAPNLANGTGSFISAAHPEWDSSKGFIVPNPLGAANTHFPRTGFHGAFFDITVAGATAANVISATGTSGVLTQGSVTATLTEVGTPGTTNVVRVTLTGPNNATGGGSFSASTFTIKSSATNDIYTFALSKWFIAKQGGAGGYPAAQTYCSGLSGSYRVPSVSEYTNANGNNWSWGLTGQGNTYARAIGNGKRKIAVTGDDSKGGLFAEWGFTYNGYYTSSDFEQAYYWAVEPFSTTQHDAGSFHGFVNSNTPSHTGYRATCVMP